MATRIDRALHIQRTLGTRAAAGYLRNQGKSLRFALWVLVRGEEGVKREMRVDMEGEDTF